MRSNVAAAYDPETIRWFGIDKTADVFTMGGDLNDLNKFCG